MQKSSASDPTSTNPLQLEVHNRALNELLEISHAMSREEKVQDIFNKATKYLVRTSVFDFDFCIIYLIDKSLRRIEEVFYQENVEGFVEAFRKKGDEIENEKDTLLYVVRQNASLKVIGEDIFHADTGEKIVDECEHDWEFFRKKHHNRFARLIVPLQYHAQTKIGTKEGDHTIGVIEVGGYKKNYQQIEKQLIGLKFFAHNCSMAYFRAREEEEDNEIAELFERVSQASHHESFLKQLLIESVEMVGGSYAEIISLTFNQDFVKITSGPIEEGHIPKPILISGQKEIREIEQLFASLSQQPEYLIFSRRFGNKESIRCRNSHSKLSIPTYHAGQMTALVNFYSEREDFFGEWRANKLTKLIQLSTPKYYQKKLKYVVENRLVNPLPIVTKLEDQTKSIIGTIKNYFNSDFVSFWQRTGDTPNTYKQALGSPRLRGECQSFGTKSKIIPDLEGVPIKLSQFDEETQDPFADNFRAFAKARNIHSLLSAIIKIGNEEFGFLNIYSCRKIEAILPEDETFLLLVANKIARSIQSGILYRSFTRFSTSLTTAGHIEMLQQLVNTAHELLYSDPVILHVYKATEKNFLNQVIVAGNLNDERVKEVSHDRGSVVHGVITRKKNQYWIRSKAEFLASFHDYELSSHLRPEEPPGEDQIIFNANFWEREGIQSMAASRLMFEGKPVGVLFFNYRKPQAFDKDTRDLITAFSNQAAIAIILNRFISSQKEVVESIKDDIPTFTQAMLADLSKPVSHEIKNHLAKIGQLMYHLETEIKSSTLRKKIYPRINDINDLTEAVNSLLKLNNNLTTSEDLDINEVIRNCLKIYRTSDNKHIHFDTTALEEDLPLIHCNKTELSMILYNIISNAIKAVHIKQAESGWIQFQTDFDKQKNYRIIVKDNGIGIKEYDLPLIFDHGFSTTKIGSGIGLYYVKKMLESEKFRGSIEIRSAYHRGTTVTIKIPRLKSASHK